MRKIITGIAVIAAIMMLLTVSAIPAISASIAKENIETKTITIKFNELVSKMEKDPLVIYYTRDNIITENELNSLAERYSSDIEELANIAEKMVSDKVSEDPEEFSAIEVPEGFLSDGFGVGSFTSNEAVQELASLVKYNHDTPNSQCVFVVGLFLIWLFLHELSEWLWGLLTGNWPC